MQRRKRKLPELPGRQDGESLVIGKEYKINVSELASQRMKGDRSNSFRLNGKKATVSKLDAAGACVILRETGETICNLHPRALSLIS